MVAVATHKKYLMPKDKMYLPLEVGVSCHGKKTNYAGDDSGDNISKKNEGFCELTGLYYIWKNIECDYKGLVHYRRYFRGKRVFSRVPEKRLEAVLSYNDAKKILEKFDVVLPKKRNYFIENLYDHYIHTMFARPLEITGEIIAEKYPDYVNEFELLHKRKTAHMFNMLIMKDDLFDEYCKWLFGVLFELEKRVKKEGLEYDGFHGRFYGRVSELLLDVYLRTNHIEYVEVPVISIEPVNWMKKGSSFLRAKFFKKKYKESF